VFVYCDGVGFHDDFGGSRTISFQRDYYFPWMELRPRLGFHGITGIRSIRTGNRAWIPGV
jgi:hypothetical protein